MRANQRPSPADFARSSVKQLAAGASSVGDSGLPEPCGEVTAVSHNSGTRRTREDTRGHGELGASVQEDTDGTAGIRKDTPLCRFGTVRPRVQIPGPRPNLGT